MTAITLRGSLRSHLRVTELAANPRGIAQVIFCCFSAESGEHHKDAFADLGLI